MSSIEKYVSFALVPPEFHETSDRDIGFCVLVPRFLQESSSEFKYNGSALEIPRSGVFDLEFRAGLITLGKDFGAETSGREHVLADRIDEQMKGLLDCVHTPRIHLDDHTSTPQPTSRIDFVIVAAHASAEKGQIGGHAVDKLSELLDSVECTELLLLACRGGCESMASKLAVNDRIVVSPARVVDTRKAYIFALYYLWKRFGEGWSAAQTLGSQPVTGNDFRLFHRGRSI